MTSPFTLEEPNDLWREEPITWSKPLPLTEAELETLHVLSPEIQPEAVSEST